MNCTASVLRQRFSSKLVAGPLIAAFFCIVAACSQQTEHNHIDQVGDTFEIRIKQTSRNSSDGSSGSSTSNMALTERVIALRNDGIELEFDFPSGTSEEYRRKQWQYPARVFRSWDGTYNLTNEPDLETRLQAWLDLSEIDRSACGTWFFTWTVEKIECDPNSVLSVIYVFDMRTQSIREGLLYSQSGGLGSSELVTENSDPQAPTLTVELPLDPESVRVERAESDIVVAAIMTGETLSLHDALQDKYGEEITGSLRISFDLDAVGRITKKVTAVDAHVTLQDGTVEQTNTKTTLTRTLIGGPSVKSE